MTGNTRSASSILRSAETNVIRIHILKILKHVLKIYGPLDENIYVCSFHFRPYIFGQLLYTYISPSSLKFKILILTITPYLTYLI